MIPMTYKQIDADLEIGPAGPDLNLNKILIVDDIPENRLLMEYMFRKTDFTLSLAENASEALAKARTELPALIISDIQMPGLSGFDLVATLKANEQTRNISVILVTA